MGSSTCNGMDVGALSHCDTLTCSSRRVCHVEVPATCTLTPVDRAGSSRQPDHLRVTPGEEAGRPPASSPRLGLAGLLPAAAAVALSVELLVFEPCAAP